MTRVVSISNLGPTHPQHPSSRGASTLIKVVGSTGPVLPSWRLQKIAGGLIQFEGLRLPGVIGGLPFRTPTRGPRWPAIRRLAASRGHRRSPRSRIIGSVLIGNKSHHHPSHPCQLREEKILESNSTWARPPKACNQNRVP